MTRTIHQPVARPDLREAQVRWECGEDAAACSVLSAFSRELSALQKAHVEPPCWRVSPGPVHSVPPRITVCDTGNGYQTRAMVPSTPAASHFAYLGNPFVNNSAQDPYIQGGRVEGQLCRSRPHRGRPLHYDQRRRAGSSAYRFGFGATANATSGYELAAFKSSEASEQNLHKYSGSPTYAFGLGLPTFIEKQCLGGVMMMPDEFERVLVECAAGTSRSTDEGDIIELADGRLLVVWSDYESGGFPESPTCILAMTSDDMGQSWSAPRTFEENAAQESLMCLSLLRAASGSLLLFYGRRKSNSDFQVLVRRSGDEGRSWGEPVMITAGDGYCVMINARTVRLSSGRIIAPVERTEDCGRPDHVLISTAFFSDDDGETWTKSATDISLPKRGALEPGVVELADGRLLMTIRTELGCIYRSYSCDEGMTWSSAEPMSIPAARSANAAISRIPDTDDLLLVCRGCFGQDALLAAVSSDGGESWAVRRSLEDAAGHAYAYPSVNFAGDRVLLTYWVTDKQAEPARLYMKFRSVPVRGLYADD